MIVLLIGPSGAGKGTQADLLAENAGIRHISTGDLFRDQIRRGTELGRRVKHHLDAGDLVPEELPTEMIRIGLRESKPEDPICLDGYPRTIYQATRLDTFVEHLGRDIAAVFFLDVSDDEIVGNRIPGRLTCRDCQRPFHETHNPPREAFTCDACGGELYRRNDDTPQRTRARLDVHHRESASIVEHYQRAGKLWIVDGQKPIAEVQASLLAAVHGLERGQKPPTTEAQVNRILERARRPVEAVSPRKDTLDVVLFGPPGSGKGTQAEGLRNRFEIPHVATGDIFRRHLREDTELGQLAKGYMERGELVPDDVTQSMVRDRLGQDDTARGFLLDGFPRTLPQADALDDMLAELGRRLTVVLFLDVPDDEILRRLSGRRICRNCQVPYHVEMKQPAVEGVCDACGGEIYQRDDDRPETVKARLRTYHDQSEPLAEHYRKKGVLLQLKASGEPDEVGTQLVAAIERRLETTSS